ncbi:MAG: N-acetylneuraminate synthase family protein [Candidatus Nitrosocosmicus sp.]|nr:N-acetylneuraminate synthase family protein [Candidatus Nitrosocosmicus sp.]MDN5868582.1 N-acetylneuraminate synthase family protein [Candidatus Nitrosocosmicus sp.]
MNEIQIGKNKIGKEDECFIIAEAASNHEQNKQNAFKLIETAAGAEADSVKFQLFKASTLYSKFVDSSTYEETSRLQLPIDWIPELRDKCSSHDITFLATPFDIESIDYLARIDIPAIKWASGDLDNIGFLSYAAKLSKPMLIATGMSSIADVELAVKTVTSEGNRNIALLHCISNYPTKFQDANLRMMDTLREVFEYPIGYSDHTLGISVSIAAVARGAKIIEKHFTLDKNINSPDHPFSIHPTDLKLLVKSIREVASSLGTKHKSIIPSEKKFASYGKRSIVADNYIKKGTKITSELINYKRPGTGISPKYIQYVLGRVTEKDISKDEIITWNHLV